MPTTASQVLSERLGLTDEEILEILDADPLDVISDDLEHKPQLRLLLAITDEAAERVGVPVLQRWVRTSGPAGRPLELLLRRDFAGFEDALGTLDARGLVIRKSDRAGPPRSL